MHLKSIISLVLAPFLLFNLSTTSHAQTIDDLPSISLFNGTDLFGWKAENKDADWKVVNGEIRVTQGSPGLLRTTSQFDNYVLTMEFWATETTNSGVFVRTSPIPKQPGLDCFEYNIAPANNPFPTGSLVGQVKSKLEFPARRWHQLKIEVNQEQIRGWINDQLTVSTQRGPRGRGFIGLQKNKGEVRFRKIQLTPILRPMTESDWKLDKTWDTSASWHDQKLVLEGGSGLVESKKSYGDFLFYTKFRTIAPQSNSGVFFRCIEGDKMMGYESQIEFGPNGKELEWPVGSIFRRQKASPSTANDLEWGEMLIHAEGPHFSIWINGKQVTDWSDPRQPDNNPRRGRRDKPGTFQFQGHDPKTKIEFKNMAVRELEKREKGKR